MARHKDDISDFWWRVERQLYIQNRTKKEVAIKCGFDRKNLTEKRNLSTSFLIKLCQELNVSADYLLFGKDIEKYEPTNGGI